MYDKKKKLFKKNKMLNFIWSNWSWWDIWIDRYKWKDRYMCTCLNGSRTVFGTGLVIGAFSFAKIFFFPSPITSLPYHALLMAAPRATLFWICGLHLDWEEEADRFDDMVRLVRPKWMGYWLCETFLIEYVRVLSTCVRVHIYP